MSRDDQGSVLLLFPAAFVVVLTLGAIAIDAGVVFLGQRELIAAASAAANDAATVGLDLDELRASGEVRIDAVLAEETVARSLLRRGTRARLTRPPDVAVSADGRVVVMLEAEVDYVIAKALPGSPGSRRVLVTVRSAAILE